MPIVILSILTLKGGVFLSIDLFCLHAVIALIQLLVSLHGAILNVLPGIFCRNLSLTKQFLKAFYPPPRRLLSLSYQFIRVRGEAEVGRNP